VYWISYCPLADRILLKLPAPHARLGRPALCHHLQEFNFLASLIVGYDVLFQTSVVRKSMQSQNFDVCKFVELTEGHEFVNEYV